MLLFEKVIATHLVEKFFSFHGTKMFIGPLDSVLSQTNPVSIHVPDLFIKTPFHTLLHLHLTSSMDSTHFFYRYFVGISHSHNACYIPHPSYSHVSIILSCEEHKLWRWSYSIIVSYSILQHLYVLSEIWIIFLVLHLQDLLTWAHHFCLYSSSNITWTHLCRDNFCMNVYRGVDV
jgi:hypothetical protein